MREEQELFVRMEKAVRRINVLVAEFSMTTFEGYDHSFVPFTKL